eukprot:2611169-Prymnesium_polylepis.1
MAQGRSVKKKKFPSFLQTLFAAQSHGVLSVTSHTSPRLWARMCVKELRFCATARREDHRR